MNTHVCLVSAQLIPNVLPVLAERPRQAVLLITPQMENQGRLLEKFFRERGVQTVSYPIPAYDFAGVLAVCKTVIQKFCTTDEPIITLNVTGGTKVAALAAYQQFYFASQRIIYRLPRRIRICLTGEVSRSFFWLARSCYLGRDVHFQPLCHRFFTPGLHPQGSLQPLDALPPYARSKVPYRSRL